MFNNDVVNIKLASYFFSISLLVLSSLMLLTGLAGFFFNEDDGHIFYILSGITAIISLVLFFWVPSQRKASVTTKDSFFIVVFLWLIMPIFGMLPFYFASPINNITDSLFESYAGFTTTGFTTLSEYENVTKTVVLWRSVIQWIGGMGLLLFIITLFPYLSRGNTKIFYFDMQDTEVNPMHQKIATTARILWLVYLVYTIFGIAALYFSGMSIYDSIIYSFAAISTGGGVPINGDLTYLPYDKKAIIMALMFIAGANYFFLFKSIRKFRITKSEELNTYFFVLLISFALIATAGIAELGYSQKMVFESLFNVVSFVSTTGFFSAQVFSTNILFVWVVLFFLLFIGSSSGSSGGGINIFRIIVLYKMTKNYIKNTIHPSSLDTMKLDGQQIKFDHIHSIIAFFVLYIFIFFIGVVLLTAFGYNLEHAFSLCAASMSNTGPGVFLLNEDISITDINTGAKYSVILLMIIGRVELIPFLIIISKTFWRV